MESPSTASRWASKRCPAAYRITWKASSCRASLQKPEKRRSTLDVGVGSSACLTATTSLVRSTTSSPSYEVLRCNPPRALATMPSHSSFVKNPCTTLHRGGDGWSALGGGRLRQSGARTTRLASGGSAPALGSSGWGRSSPAKVATSAGSGARGWRGVTRCSLHRLRTPAGQVKALLLERVAGARRRGSGTRGPTQSAQLLCCTPSHSRSLRGGRGAKQRAKPADRRLAAAGCRRHRPRAHERCFACLRASAVVLAHVYKTRGKRGPRYSLC